MTLEEYVDFIDDNNIVILPTEPKTKKSNKTSRSEQSKSSASPPGKSQGAVSIWMDKISR